MKPWKSISVVLLSGVSAIALAACEEPRVDAAIYDDLQQCIEDPDIPRDQCLAAYKEARSQHASVAPKYSSKEECQADFGDGKCERAPYQSRSGGGIFMPMMMGYMMGSYLGGGRRSVASQPLYRSADDAKTYRTADNRKAGSTTGRTQIASSAASRPSVKSSTLSRGGFGSSGRRYGSAAT
jgi:uncharacterized protein YgiB involved in biofilm formation